MRIRNATLAAGLAAAALCIPAAAQQVTDDGYARDLTGQVWKNPFGLCWRTYNWTPEKAIAECDPDLVKKPEPARPAPPVVVAPPNPQPTLAPPPPAPVATTPPPPAPPPAPVRRTQSLTLGADATFDTGKADLKPEGRAKLDDLAAKLKAPGVTLESMTVTGHTDSVGSAASNQRLSERRADAVKSYLVAQGVDGSKIRTQGKGLTQPVADNKTAAGRAQNRRVDVEISAQQQQ
jgi:OmpA-OmpF porin, OOP family